MTHLGLTIPEYKGPHVVMTSSHSLKTAERTVGVMDLKHVKGTVKVRDIKGAVKELKGAIKEDGSEAGNTQPNFILKDESPLLHPTREFKQDLKSTIINTQGKQQLKKDNPDHQTSIKTENLLPEDENENPDKGSQNDRKSRSENAPQQRTPKQGLENDTHEISSLDVENNACLNEKEVNSSCDEKTRVFQPEFTHKGQDCPPVLVALVTAESGQESLKQTLSLDRVIGTSSENHNSAPTKKPKLE